MSIFRFLHRAKSLPGLILPAALLLAASAASLATAVEPIWQLGTADDSAAEFGEETAAAGAERAIPADWATRTDWRSVPKGLRGDSAPSLDLTYDLDTIPADGAEFAFKLLNAPKAGAQMAVFSNGTMAGLIQLWGSAGTGSPYRWQRTYRLYLPKELLSLGRNRLRLETARPLWSGPSVDKEIWWEWDFLRLGALRSPALEPIHGAEAFLGTTIKKSSGDFKIDDDTLRIAPLMLPWMGIAYSGNTIRADFWYDVAQVQPRRLEYLALLRKLGMTVVVDHVSGSHFHNDPDGRMPKRIQAALDDFFKNYGSYFDFYEIGNEPCMFGGGFAETLEVARYVNKIKPPWVQTTSPGWAYGGGKGTPTNWDADVRNRREVEALCGVTNGHSYGYSYADLKGGSFVENLATVQGVEDGWPTPFLNTETGTNNWHSEENGTHFSSTEPHAQAFDGIIRAHLAVVNRTMQHASIFDDFGLFKAPVSWAEPETLSIYPGVNGEDSRLKTYRRLALAYATHGAPLAYRYADPDAISGKKIYLRAVDTAALPAPDGGGGSTKILLNFVNFEASPQTLHVKVALPEKGTYRGDRYGAGDSYAMAHREVSLVAAPEVDLVEKLGAGDAVQYVLTPPEERRPYPPTGLHAVSEAGRITLHWAASAGATSYELVHSAQEDQPFTTVATGVTETEFVHQGVIDGEWNFYRVYAVGAAGRSDPSTLVKVQAGAPKAPSGLHAVAGDRQVHLTWGEVPDATKYYVQRATRRNGPFLIVGDPATERRFVDLDLPNGAPLFYRVFAVAKRAESNVKGPESDVAFATPSPPLTAPEGLAAVGGDGRVALRWAPASDARFYSVARSNSPNGPFAVLRAQIAANCFSDDSVANGTPYAYVIAAAADGAESPASEPVTATPRSQPLPPEWNQTDIGRVGKPGHASYNPSDQIYTVSGSGNDVWGPADGAHLVYQQLTGDGAITVHLVAWDETSEWAKLGVMIREKLDANSAMAMLAFSPGKGSGMTYRATSGGECKMTGGDLQPWLRLVRKGDTFSAFVSADGEHWKERGVAEIPMARETTIGLCVCSHNDSALNKTFFDRLKIEK